MAGSECTEWMSVLALAAATSLGVGRSAVGTSGGGAGGAYGAVATHSFNFSSAASCSLVQTNFAFFFNKSNIGSHTLALPQDLSHQLRSQFLNQGSALLQDLRTSQTEFVIHSQNSSSTYTLITSHPDHVGDGWRQPCVAELLRQRLPPLPPRVHLSIGAASVRFPAKR